MHGSLRPKFAVRWKYSKQPAWLPTVTVTAMQQPIFLATRNFTEPALLLPTSSVSHHLCLTELQAFWSMFFLTV